MEWAQRLIAGLGIPVRPRDYGVEQSTAAGLGCEAWQTGQRLLDNCPRPLGEDDAAAPAAAPW